MGRKAVGNGGAVVNHKQRFIILYQEIILNQILFLLVPCLVSAFANGISQQEIQTISMHKRLFLLCKGK